MLSPANPNGPIADGSQLVDITTDPGNGAGKPSTGDCTETAVRLVFISRFPFYDAQQSCHPSETSTSATVTSTSTASKAISTQAAPTAGASGRISNTTSTSASGFKARQYFN